MPESRCALRSVIIALRRGDDGHAEAVMDLPECEWRPL
jgi:hypothetical protein